MMDIRTKHVNFKSDKDDPVQLEGELTVGQDGVVQIEARETATNAVERLFTVLLEWFIEAGAPNYVEQYVQHGVHGAFRILVQKDGGETPAQQNVRLRAQLAAAEARLTACAACKGTGVDESGVCHCGQPMDGHSLYDNHSAVEMTRPCEECTARLRLRAEKSEAALAAMTERCEKAEADTRRLNYIIEADDWLQDWVWDLASMNWSDDECTVDNMRRFIDGEIDAAMKEEKGV